MVMMGPVFMASTTAIFTLEHLPIMRVGGTLNRVESTSGIRLC